MQVDGIVEMNVGPDVESRADGPDDATFASLLHQQRDLHAVRCGTPPHTVDHRVAQDDRVDAPLACVLDRSVEDSADRLVRLRFERPVVPDDLFQRIGAVRISATTPDLLVCRKDEFDPEGSSSIAWTAPRWSLLAASTTPSEP